MRDQGSYDCLLQMRNTEFLFRMNFDLTVLPSLILYHLIDINLLGKEIPDPSTYFKAFS